jgi:hypothetical protein
MFGKLAAPSKVPTDLVILFRFFMMRHSGKLLFRIPCLSSTIFWILGSYKKSLKALVKRGGWHKLGPRLRRSVRNSIAKIIYGEILTACQDKGDLGYHVAVEFSKQRPGLTYTHNDYAINAADHPLASKLPKASWQPAIVCDPMSSTI